MTIWRSPLVSEETNKLREKRFNLFKKNIFLIVANEERILSDLKFGRVMVPTHLGNCYCGSCYDYSLRRFLILWRTCPGAVVFDENNEMAFVYACSGGLSGGWCGFANEDGTDPINGKGIDSRCYYSSVFGTVHKMFTRKYKDETWTWFGEPYDLEEAIKILKRKTDEKTYTENLKKYKRQILRSRRKSYQLLTSLFKKIVNLYFGWHML